MLHKHATLASFAFFISYSSMANAEVSPFQLSGVVEGNYQYQEYAETEKSKVRFYEVALNMNYQKDNWSGLVTTRCYQSEELCDLTVLSDAYFSYQFDPNRQISVGLQPIPFGVDNFWDSSFYESLMYSVGMQDTHNIGFRYDQQLQNHQVSIGYFPTDGGSYIGSSKDAARYSTNFIKSNEPDATRINEENMLFAKYSYNKKLANIDYTLGSSVWFSSLDNLNTHKTGSRINTNIFSVAQRDQFESKITVGYQDIDNAQAGLNYSTVGSFDSEFNLANKATYYVADFAYNIPDHFQNLTGFKPYLVFSGLMKQEGMPNSYRNIAGLQFDYKQLHINAEYIFSKNDIIAGEDINAFANAEDTQWKQLLYINFGFNF